MTIKGREKWMIIKNLIRRERKRHKIKKYLIRREIMKMLLIRYIFNDVIDNGIFFFLKV